MKKINIVKKNEDYSRLIKKGRKIGSKNLLVFIEKNDDKLYHFGFSVSKKVGNAVTRNHIKRQLKSILDEKNYEFGFNCIIIVKRSIIDITFQDMHDELLNLIQKLDIIKGEN